jgi:hypothetical protein
LSSGHVRAQESVIDDGNLTVSIACLSGGVVHENVVDSCAKTADGGSGSDLHASTVVPPILNIGWTIHDANSCGTVCATRARGVDVGSLGHRVLAELENLTRHISLSHDTLDVVDGSGQNTHCVNSASSLGVTGPYTVVINEVDVANNNTISVRGLSGPCEISAVGSSVPLPDVIGVIVQDDVHGFGSVNFNTHL